MSNFVRSLRDQFSVTRKIVEEKTCFDHQPMMVASTNFWLHHANGGSRLPQTHRIQEHMDVAGQAFFDVNCDMVNQIIHATSNASYSLKSVDFLSPTFYGEHINGSVKCLSYKLTHTLRDNFLAKKFMFSSRRFGTRVEFWGQVDGKSPRNPIVDGFLSLSCWCVGGRWTNSPVSLDVVVRLMQKLWHQLVNANHDAMLTMLTPKMDPFSKEAFNMTRVSCRKMSLTLLESN